MAKVKFRSGNVLIPGEMTIVGSRIEFNFGYAPGIQAEIKMMDGSRYHGFDENPRKIWSVKNNQRNWFQINWLRYNPSDPSTNNPYSPYEQGLIPVTSDRPLYEHQLYGKSLIVTRRQLLLAWEMGCVEGEAIVHIDRGGKGLKITLHDLYRKFNGLNSRGWDFRIPTKIRSLMSDGIFGLNEVKSVLRKGKKQVLRLTLASGKSVRLTPDHEVAIGLNSYLAAYKLKLGDTVLSNGTWIDNALWKMR